MIAWEDDAGVIEGRLIVDNSVEVLEADGDSLYATLSLCALACADSDLGSTRTSSAVE